MAIRSGQEEDKASSNRASGDASIANAFHRWMTLAEIRRHAAPLTINANADERAAIAVRFDLVGLDRLDARLTFRFDGDILSVGGDVSGDVVQRCVATDEPLPSRVTTPLDVRYVPLEKLEAAEQEAEIELGAHDLDIIGYTGSKIDLGEMIADTLYLALDPFPRLANADDFLKERGVKSENEVGAFGALAALRDKLSGES
jgi:uncharacterized metal-binding protein YceD (DUF177 family)